MGDAPGALGGAIHQDKAFRDCYVSFPKRTILSSASVGIRAGDVTTILSSASVGIRAGDVTINTHIQLKFD